MAAGVRPTRNRTAANTFRGTEILRGISVLGRPPAVADLFVSDPAPLSESKTAGQRPDGIGRMAGGVDGTKLLDDMPPLHRHAKPDQIARSALYLASDRASFVTAATLMADGGLRG